MAKGDDTSYKGEVNPQQGNNTNDVGSVNNKASIGYADGYASYVSKSGAHETDGTRRDTQITKGDGKENVKSDSPDYLLDSQTSLFRRINGYGDTDNTSSDNLEDPTYLIFDISVNKSESPLFNNVSGFMDEYSDSVPEIAERRAYYDEFVNIFLKVFPSDIRSDGDGAKKHYIEQISNLDVLLKPLINYPDDTINIILSEDITMNTQYLIELYNNLIYSYDSHRYLIPDNLLRFDLKIVFRDIRNYKNHNYTSEFNEDNSMFVYILHDCQLDFMSSRTFGNEMRVGGFGAGTINTIASASFDINFKSYSKITAPLLIDNSKVIDFKERETQTDGEGNHNKDFYKHIYAGDYQTSDEYIDKKNINDGRNINTKTLAPLSSNIVESAKEKAGNPFFKNVTKIIKEEIIEVRNIIVKQIYEEVSQLVTLGQRYLGEEFGFTLGKTNVYYNSLEEKITRFGYFFEDILDDTLDDLLNNPDNVETTDPRTGNVYTQSNFNNREDIINDKNTHPSDSIYYGNGDAPSGDITDINTDGDYNTKLPDGDLHDDGVYNQKLPDGDLHDDGVYNQKLPDGDLHDDRTYNEKYPSGDLHDDRTYNEKIPDGDLHDDRTYNEKFPNGKVHENGQYVIKFPDGDVHSDGKYHSKSPNGNIYK